MKRHLITVTLCAALAAVLFTGNAARAAEASDKAEQAYMDFLSGKTKVTTSEKFLGSNGKEKYGELPYGTYSYKELKDAVAEIEAHSATTKYALVDFGQDGTKELVLRLDNVDPSFLNWIGIIKYDGKALNLNYYYEDGSRIVTTLYTSGYLKIGGAIGAGCYNTTLVGFDESGCGAEVFSVNEFSNIVSATSIMYDLQKSTSDLTNDYNLSDSDFIVREHAANGRVKISVDGWSKNQAFLQKEKQLVKELENFSAEVVSTAEMDRLCDMAQYCSESVTWLQ